MNPNSGCLISVLASLGFWVVLFMWSWKVASLLVFIFAIGMIVVLLATKDPEVDDPKEYEQHRFIG